MRLAEFILANMEPILGQWEDFAREIWPAPASKNPAELRDNAEAILRTVAADMQSSQSADQQSAKSMGHGGSNLSSRRLDSASNAHGNERVASGFTLTEMIAEYRALRSSVIRLWRDSVPNPHLADIDDLTRFQEAIDQSLARAVESFSDRLDRARGLFLAILGHDLRGPLGAIRIWAKLLTKSNVADVVEAGKEIEGSTAVMARLIEDLLDFTAAGIGGLMPIQPGPADLHAICFDVVNEIRRSYPQCQLTYTHEGDLAGHWDAARLRQVVSNLLNNAVQHGGGKTKSACRLDLQVRNEGNDVLLTVHNDGPPIPPTVLSCLFDPLRRAAAADEGRPHQAGRTGLGLYIVHQIVTAHGGTIEAASSEAAGTTFEVRLPSRKLLATH